MYFCSRTLRCRVARSWSFTRTHSTYDSSWWTLSVAVQMHHCLACPCTMLNFRGLFSFHILATPYWHSSFVLVRFSLHYRLLVSEWMDVFTWVVFRRDLLGFCMVLASCFCLDQQRCVYVRLCRIWCAVNKKHKHRHGLWWRLKVQFCLVKRVCVCQTVHFWRTVYSQTQTHLRLRSTN